MKAEESYYKRRRDYQKPKRPGVRAKVKIKKEQGEAERHLSRAREMCNGLEKPNLRQRQAIEGSENFEVLLKSVQQSINSTMGAFGDAVNSGVVEAIEKVRDIQLPAFEVQGITEKIKNQLQFLEKIFSNSENISKQLRNDLRKVYSRAQAEVEKVLSGDGGDYSKYVAGFKN